MKTTISSTTQLTNCKMLSMNTYGVDNIQDMYIFTQQQDTSIFNSDNYFEYDDILIGTDYSSIQYFYGKDDDIYKEMNRIIDFIKKLPSLFEEDGKHFLSHLMKEMEIVC